MKTAQNVAHSEHNSGLHPNSGRNELLVQQYKCIGETLNTCEASDFGTGITWLPPTTEVRRFSSKYESPLKDFIRYSLVGVSTNTLEQYCDDLDNISSDSTPQKTLFIREPSFLERFGLCILLFVVVFALCFAASTYLGFGLGGTAVLALIAASLAVVVSIGLCLEQHRRCSFHCVLYSELLRRRGLDQTGTSRVRILPVGSKPLSE